MPESNLRFRLPSKEVLQAALLTQLEQTQELDVLAMLVMQAPLPKRKCSHTIRAVALQLHAQPIPMDFMCPVAAAAMQDSRSR